MLLGAIRILIPKGLRPPPPCPQAFFFKTLWVYRTGRCGSCAVKADCTTEVERKIRRWEKEDVLDKAAAELKQERDAMHQLKALVEHPFATLKHAMGATHFLSKRLPSVRAEMSLHILAYNMKREIKVLGTKNIINALQSA